MPLDDVLSKREDMNALLRVRLDEVTERWGVKVTNVEVREVNPPPGVLEAMTRQMSAERTRRAQVTEAEGQKSAAILAAEGERQAAITLAEGTQKAAILAAEGERQAAVLKAQGYSVGLETILRCRTHARREHAPAAVPRHAEADRLLAVDQVRRADGAGRPAAAACGRYCPPRRPRPRWPRRRRPTARTSHYSRGAPPRGSRTLKTTLPPPPAAAVTVPPWARTIDSTIESPRPAPPC